MNTSYLLLGSNQGNREQFLKQALTMISDVVGDITDTSSVYETAAWGDTEQAEFLNQVVKVETKLKPKDLLKSILQIESKLGRRRSVKNAARTIDIDILFFKDIIVREPGLQIPHPQIQNRRFVLVPLHEVVPDFQHPILHKSIKSLLDDCPDHLEVKLYSGVPTE
jgi:2-amino-4-hydroxy-6-hydroxymethyldihydropteridine diphosphokinase